MKHFLYAVMVIYAFSLNNYGVFPQKLEVGMLIPCDCIACVSRVLMLSSSARDN